MALTTVAVLAAGCSSGPITNTDDTPAAGPVGTSMTPSAPPPGNAHLANAFDYVAHPPGGTTYYFTSPSGAWACALVPRVKAGCQSVNNWPSGLGITGAPDSVPDATGDEVSPNAVVVPREGDARFVALEQPEFALKPGPAKVLPFNRILAAAGFRCNVQEATGVSCLSEFSGKGFTFSPDGFAPRYTDVPVGAP
ncbi:hypothetical protein BST36_09815 [Mycolicibacterium moriokaense]|nr:hypothetical protein [Mycolicibacterium moriokaense]MCV7038478.1 hypothetical protein [Mycolicibacterium moriokaense]ORB24951.1 hypothetical protein BST36_09815 [Mycolicibacterium moriokaense]